MRKYTTNDGDRNDDVKDEEPELLMSWANHMLQGSSGASPSNGKCTTEQQVDLYPMAETSSAPSSLIYWQVSTYMVSVMNQ